MLFARYSNKILLFIVSPFLCTDINLVTLVMLGTVILVCITVYHPRGHVVPFAVTLLCPLWRSLERQVYAELFEFTWLVDNPFTQDDIVIGFMCPKLNIIMYPCCSEIFHVSPDVHYPTGQNDILIGEYD